MKSESGPWTSFLKSSKTVSFWRSPDILFTGFLLIAIVLLYGPYLNHEFIFDDNIYIGENHIVQRGVVFETLKWAFTDAAELSWQPLTWITLMIDADIYGGAPFGYHLTNLVLHILSSLILFFTLRGLTSRFWPSALVAALFALHPINVETVAWASQRKNILSGLFWMLAMWAYVWYARRPDLWRYLLVSLFFVLGLMSKLTMVPFPMAMLLLDYWPLGRLRVGNEGEPCGVFRMGRMKWLKLVIEKMPWLVLGGGVVFALVFFDPNEMMSGPIRPWSLRLSNAVVSYVVYLGKIFWPVDLAVWYPFPDAIPLWQVIGSLVFLSLLTWGIWRWKNNWSYLIVGWLWYLGNLVPALGLVQNEVWPGQADHHLYLPALGIFMMISYGLFDLVQGRSFYRPITVSVLVGLLVVLTFTAHQQLSYWRTGQLLYEHTLKVTSNNWLARINFGQTFQHVGKPDQAIPHYLEALRLKPDSFHANSNCGSALLVLGQPKEALFYLQRAVWINPKSAKALSNIGTALGRLGQPREALIYYRKALRLDPSLIDVAYNMGQVLIDLGQTKEAAQMFRKVLSVDPEHEAARNVLDVLENQKNKTNNKDRGQKDTTE